MSEEAISSARDCQQTGSCATAVAVMDGVIINWCSKKFTGNVEGCAACSSKYGAAEEKLDVGETGEA